MVTRAEWIRALIFLPFKGFAKLTERVRGGESGTDLLDAGSAEAYPPVRGARRLTSRTRCRNGRAGCGSRRDRQSPAASRGRSFHGRCGRQDQTLSAQTPSCMSTRRQIRASEMPPGVVGPRPPQTGGTPWRLMGTIYLWP